MAVHSNDSSPEPRRVLVADDVKSIARSIAGILETEGFKTATAKDGEDCLAQVEAFRPHLIILDLLMPRMHGIDVLKSLRENPDYSNIGVIVNSTKDFGTEFLVAKELGAFGRINKPTTRVELLERVKQFFDNESPLESKPANVPFATDLPEYLPALTNERGVLRFWGTRGSFPVSGAEFLRHGGHTTCMEFDAGTDLLIFDAGSGLRELGNRLAASEPRHIHLFITHTHWDHIQGFPAFAPIYNPQSKITVYGDKGFGEKLEAVITGQLSSDYFPVVWDEVRAEVRFKYLNDDPTVIGDVTVTRDFTNHPGATLAYKVELKGHTTVFMPDNEFLQGYLGPPHDIKAIEHLLTPYEKIVEFVSGADVLIHEAQYLNKEYPDRIGWGHSCLSNACLLVSLGQVKRWIVVHHDTAHDDAMLGEKLALTRQILRSLQSTTEVVHAYDGMVEWL